MDISMVGHICHSPKQTENNVKMEELFEDDANYPETKDATYVKLKDFNEERKGTGTSQYQKKLKNTCNVWACDLSTNYMVKDKGNVLGQACRRK